MARDGAEMETITAEAGVVNSDSDREQRIATGTANGDEGSDSERWQGQRQRREGQCASRETLSEKL